MEIVENPTKQKPTLVTILCIFTFIGSGLGIVTNIFGMILSPIANFFEPDFFEMTLNNIQDDFVSELVEQALLMGQKAIHHLFEISLVKLLLYAASLTGAILMFQLKKTGFYIYTTAQIFLLLVAPAFIGFNLFTNFGILFSSVFTILFIALYAIHLKKMN
jgi:hypothetical protein